MCTPCVGFSDTYSIYSIYLQYILTVCSKCSIYPQYIKQQQLQQYIAKYTLILMCPHSRPAMALDARGPPAHHDQPSEAPPVTQSSPPLCRPPASMQCMQPWKHSHTCTHACMPINWAWLQVEPCTARSGTARQGVRPNCTCVHLAVHFGFACVPHHAS